MATATTDHQYAVQQSDISVVCVGTPAKASGDLDLAYVERVLNDILKTDSKSIEHRQIILRSSVPPGTHTELIQPLLDNASGSTSANYAYYPEFLREGEELADIAAPPLNVYAATTERIITSTHELFDHSSTPLRKVSFGEAEMLKYASNSFHALKVVFANEIAAIAGSLGIEGQQVMKEFVLDTKLNVSHAYLRPGFAFGGSCLPKDTQALINTAERLGVAVPILSSILPSNNRRIVTVLEEIERLEARRIGFWGVAFKPGTDDTRESPILKVVDELLLRRTQYQQPIDLVIADEAPVLNTIKNRLSGQSRLTTSTQDFCHELDLIVLGTREIDPDLRKLISKSSIPVIDLAYFDADPAIAKEPNYRLLS
jgi:GDP-mannose 6-dehydrogenase